MKKLLPTLLALAVSSASFAAGEEIRVGEDAERHGMEGVVEDFRAAGFQKNVTQDGKVTVNTGITSITTNRNGAPNAEGPNSVPTPRQEFIQFTKTKTA